MTVLDAIQGVKTALDDIEARQGRNRELSLAKTKLDECRLWASEYADQHGADVPEPPDEIPFEGDTATGS